MYKLFMQLHLLEATSDIFKHPKNIMCPYTNQVSSAASARWV